MNSEHKPSAFNAETDPRDPGGLQGTENVTCTAYTPTVLGDDGVFVV